MPREWKNIVWSVRAKNFCRFFFFEIFFFFAFLIKGVARQPHIHRNCRLIDIVYIFVSRYCVVHTGFLRSRQIGSHIGSHSWKVTGTLIRKKNISWGNFCIPCVWVLAFKLCTTAPHTQTGRYKEINAINWEMILEYQPVFGLKENNEIIKKNTHTFPMRERTGIWADNKLYTIWKQCIIYIKNGQTLPATAY